LIEDTMALNPLRRLAPATAACLLLAATGALQAQQRNGAPTRPDPLDPKSPVPALVYESTLSQAPRAGSEGPVGWREANDKVARIGGWRAYAREAQQPDPAKPSTAAPPAAPRPAPQPAAAHEPAGHGAHGSGVRP
jgi:hypothetical protein